MHEYGRTASTAARSSAIPLGGYVKMFGEREVSGEDEVPRPLTAAEKQVSFRYKSLGRRAAIVFADVRFRDMRTRSDGVFDVCIAGPPT